MYPISCFCNKKTLAISHLETRYFQLSTRKDSYGMTTSREDSFNFQYSVVKLETLNLKLETKNPETPSIHIATPLSGLV